ncbi:MAG: Fe-S cluster domain-containing protein [Rikenellaceae bacterium]
MNETFIFTVVTLCALGGVAAVVLYIVAQKFKVYEDPRIDEVEKMLPGANCGGCGYPGCRGLSDALVSSDNIDNLFCPVGGGDTMKAIATYLGKAAAVKEPQIAVVKCNGNCDKRPRTNVYDGAKSCAVAASLYGGETGCSYGCLGLGDCVSVCKFGALSIDPETKLPVIDEEKCTACGKCADACPKMVIELRKKGPKGRRIYVNCSNKDKGAVARKACSAACIGCGKCVKTCPFGAITLENNLAYIDPALCKLCRKCAEACPTGAIAQVNFPPRPPKKEGEEVAKPKVAPKAAEPKATETKVQDVKATEPKATEITVESKAE